MNLLFVRTGDSDQDSILPEAAKELWSFGVRSRLVWDVEPRWKHYLWTLGLPTCVVGLKTIRRFTPRWAKIFQQIKYDKVQEYQALEQAGIPVPKWVALHEGDEPDLSQFDDYVVTKPAAGCRGAFVRIMRRNRVRWRNFDLEHRRGESTAVIVQNYVHTGPKPVSYRVATVFGEPFYAWRVTAAKRRTPFEERAAGSQFFAGKTIVSTSKGCIMDPEVPADVVQFSKQVYKAFPDVPILAIDIIRDYDSQKLYVLELNTSSLNPVATPQSVSRIKREFGLDLYTQFGGAKALARGIFRRVNGHRDRKFLVRDEGRNEIMNESPYEVAEP